MNDAERAQIEEEIREVVATATRASELGDKLFTSGGLFNRIAKTEQERRQIGATSLFREAQARHSELRRKEAAEFARAVTKLDKVHAQASH